MGITGNFKEVVNSLDTDAKDFNKKRNLIIATVSLRALSDLQVMSPVKTGRFRAGHTLEINRPSKYVPSEKMGNSEANQVAAQNLAKAREKIDRAVTEEKFTIYISNNVDYAPFIENGTYCKDPNAPKKLYAKTRDRTEVRMNKMIARMK